MDAATTTDSLHQLGYTVDGTARRGATATVYPGCHTQTGQRVALKVLDTATATFDREAQILSTLEHPNVARLVDFTTLSSGQQLLVTAWANGETLADYLLRVGPIGTPQVRRILVQLGNALDYLHQRGVVHHDLSLANILIDDTGHLTVIDFGVSRSNELPTATATSDLVGTTRYLAPELLAGESPSPASDQYAAAVITYELAAGVWPFGDATNVGRTFHHHLSSQPIPLSERVPSAPASLEAALDRSLEKDPRKRFPSMQDMVDMALDIERPTRPTKRLVHAALGLAALALAAATGIGYVFFDRGEEPNESTTPTALASTPEPRAWPSGLAGELDCNLLPSPGFEVNTLPANFWENPNDPPPVRLDADGGVDGSSAIAIGAVDEFAAFGSIVDIRPNTQYLFGATVSFSDLPFTSTMSVAWIDAEFQLLDTDTPEADLTTAGPGRALLEVPSAPPGASFAVTRLYKDDSGGVLFADELIFAERDSACGQVLLEGR